MEVCPPLMAARVGKTQPTSTWLQMSVLAHSWHAFACNPRSVSMTERTLLPFRFITSPHRGMNSTCCINLHQYYPPWLLSYWRMEELSLLKERERVSVFNANLCLKEKQQAIDQGVADTCQSRLEVFHLRVVRRTHAS